MQDNWLYTIFDGHWNPSDSLENAISVDEAKAAALFRRIETRGSPTTTDDRDELCSILALQACRHPDIMHQGHRRAKELGALIASATGLTPSTFTHRMTTFGITTSDALTIYNIIIVRSPEQLAQELDELNRLSPQDHRLPEQEALRAIPLVCAQLQEMEFTLLDALPGSDFVLGDTPVPQEHLSQGFYVPISKSVAVFVRPATSPQTIVARRTATEAEVDVINKIQWNNSLHIVVGPSKAVLASL